MHPALDKLCGPGKSLKAEAPDANDIAGLLRTGVVRLGNVDERLVNDLIDATAAVAKAVQP